jgi:hypothetical protein
MGKQKMALLHQGLTLLDNGSRHVHGDGCFKPMVRTSQGTISSHIAAFQALLLFRTTSELEKLLNF